MPNSYHADLRRKRPRQEVKAQAYKDLSRLWRDGVKAWILEAIGHIRVDTGMSMASLIPLSRMVRLATTVKAAYAGRVPYRKGAFDMSGTYHPDWKRSVSAGEASAVHKNTYDILYGTRTRPVMHFIYEISVWQFYVNEQGMFGRSSWRVFASADVAMRKHIENSWQSYLKDTLDVDRWVHG